MQLHIKLASSMGALTTINDEVGNVQLIVPDTTDMDFAHRLIALWNQEHVSDTLHRKFSQDSKADESLKLDFTRLLQDYNANDVPEGQSIPLFFASRAGASLGVWPVRESGRGLVFRCTCRRELPIGEFVQHRAECGKAVEL